MKNKSIKMKILREKCLKNMLKNQFLKVKNSFLEWEKDFMKLKDRREKIKREIKELFYKPIIVPKDKMDKFEVQKMKKIRPIRNNFAWLVN